MESEEHHEHHDLVSTYSRVEATLFRRDPVIRWAAALDAASC